MLHRRARLATGRSKRPTSHELFVPKGWVRSIQQPLEMGTTPCTMTDHMDLIPSPEAHDADGREGEGAKGVRIG